MLPSALNFVRMSSARKIYVESQHWRDIDGNLIVEGTQAKDATRMLLEYFVLSVIGRRREAAEKRFDLIDKFLVASGEVSAAQANAKKSGEDFRHRLSHYFSRSFPCSYVRFPCCWR